MYSNKINIYILLTFACCFSGCSKEEKITSCPIEIMNVTGTGINPYSLTYSYSGENLAMIKKNEKEYSTFYYNQKGQLIARKRHINGVVENTDSIFYNTDGTLKKWNLYNASLMLVDGKQFNYINGRLGQVIQNLFPNFYPIVANYEYTGNDITGATIQYGGQGYTIMKYTVGQTVNPLKDMISKSHGFSTIPYITPEHVPFLFNEKAVLVMERDTVSTGYTYLIEQEKLKKLDINFPNAYKQEMELIYRCE